MENIGRLLAEYLRRYPYNFLVLVKSIKEKEWLLGWVIRQNETRNQNDIRTIARELIENCGLCPDPIDRKMPVGSGVNRVMVIMNSPVMTSRSEIELFRKDSADLLKKIISTAGLILEECYITNLVKCKSGDPVMMPSRMMERCLDVLKAEMDIIRPSIVLVFGELHPLQSIVRSSGDVEWFAVDHPVALIKNPDLKRAAWNTIKLVKEKAAGLTRG
jgi:DNA polymerase